MKTITRNKFALLICLLLAAGLACALPTVSGGEAPPASAPEQHATAPAQEEHATAPAPGEHGTPAPGEPAPSGGAVPGGGATQPPSGSTGLCANPYFPVKLGAHWIYLINGEVKFEEEITAVRADGFTMERKQENLIRPLEWTCRPEGLVALSYAEAISASTGKSLQFTTTNVTGVTLPANLAPGMTWTQTYDVTITAPGVSGSVSGTISITYSAVAIESVTVPAGTFEALKVEVQKTVQAPPGFFGPLGSTVQSAATIWLAPRIGVIKEVTDRGSVTELGVYTPD